jgi:hypothetical protein
MPNYLQRIVVSGARTTSSVKLSTSSRAVIPPIYSSIQTPMSESGQQNGGEFSDPVMLGNDEMFRMAADESAVGKQDIVSPAVVSGKEQLYSMQAMDTSSNAWSSGGEAWVTTDPSASTVRVAAPKGLRRARFGNDQQNEASQVMGQPVDHVFPQVRVAHESLSPRDVEVPQISREISDDAQSVPVASQPRPTITKETTSTAQTAVADEGARDQVLSVVESRLQAKQPSPLRFAADKQSEAARPLEARATAPRQTAPSLVFNATDKPRRNQISIGRIDVQVNNQTAPQPVGLQPTKQATHSNFFDARYLSRFFLRP